MPTAFDEMTLSDGASREGYAFLKRWLEATPPEILRHRQAEAELLFRRIGITFAVYGESRRRRAHHPLRHHPAHPDQARMDAACDAASSSGSRR